MGATLCHAEGNTMCCNAVAGEEVRHLPSDQLTTDENIVGNGGEIDNPSSKVPVSLQQLQGKWIHLDDDMPTGEIRGSTVEWDMSYQHAPSTLTLVTGLSGVGIADVEMEFAGD